MFFETMDSYRLFASKVLEIFTDYNYVSISLNNKLKIHKDKPALIDGDFISNKEVCFCYCNSLIDYRDSLVSKKWIPIDNEEVWVCMINTTNAVIFNFSNESSFLRESLNLGLIFKTEFEAKERIKEVVSFLENSKKEYFK